MNDEDIKQLNKVIKYITKTFDIEKIRNSNLIDIKESFYNKDINKDIDNLIVKINGGHEYFDKLKSELSNKFKDTKFHIKRNDRDGYYLSTTRNKGDKILEYIKEYEKKNYKEKEKDILKISDSITIKLSELNIHVSVSACKITCSLIGVKNDEMNQLFFDLDKLIKNTFTQDLRDWYSKYNNIFEKVISFVTEIDFISNNAYISNRYHYCKPEIIIKETKKDKKSKETKTIKPPESFVTSTNMRHPIIERGIQHEYVPHDICLDKNTRGNLIYGVNSCGKSSLMKSIGINVVLAQCGMYVSASDFKYYPFKSLYTRITGNDDMRNGYSSFVVELNELRNILKKSDKNTLIIGDEICRGTEYLSANSLVASSILRINDSKAKYIFSTHLHELVKLEKIKKLDKLKMFHLSIDNLNSSNELIFNRKLVEGNGEEVYGITIAKHILNDPNFISTAIEFKNEFLKEKNVSHKLMSDKKSNYNKNIYLIHVIYVTLQNLSNLIILISKKILLMIKVNSPIKIKIKII
jgi:DNA mismatch repair protein MutS